MKTETLMLIRDAKASLEKTVRTAALENPLVAAFAVWICPEQFEEDIATQAAEKSASARGGERNSRGVGVLGFVCDLPSQHSKFESSFVQHLDWLTKRPNFGTGGEPSGVLVDPIAFLGVCVGSLGVLTEAKLKEFREWAAQALKDALVIAGDWTNWQRSILDALGRKVNPNGVGGQHGETAEPWLRAALSTKKFGTATDTEVSDVLKSALQNADTVSDGFEAAAKVAAIGWAVARALDFNLAAMTTADVSRVLNNLPSAFQRWTWETKPRTNRRGALPRQWHIENEYHVQSLLYAVLKPMFPALEEEKYLSATGTYQPRADLCLLALRLVIEVKFWYRGDRAKDLIEQIAADLSLYLRPDSPYREMVAVIWDDGGRTEEHAELKRGLAGLNGVRDVVIVSRPSTMISETIEKSGPTKGNPRRANV